jgi:phosphoglycolate phosphatase-like HAD superfamily hydrolase
MYWPTGEDRTVETMKRYEIHYLQPTRAHSTNIQGVDKAMETLRNRGIEFVMATVKELQLAELNVLPFVYTL